VLEQLFTSETYPNNGSFSAYFSCLT